MSKPEFFATPGYGDVLRAQLHYSQAVRVGDRVETSGQGGWDDELNIPESVEDEILLAFANVKRTLAAAGAEWDDVFSVNSYHVVDSPDSFALHNRVMVEQFRARMKDQAPIWTQTATPVLGLPTMRVEIRVTAFVGRAAS
jgi:enamine deaminase RidA (YjgF/YER057c/UK114 family)